MPHALTIVALTLLAFGCADPGISCGASDRDGDAVYDLCDNCPYAANPQQRDSNHNGVGDRCDIDDDGDGALDFEDDCPWVLNGPEARDTDEDGLLDVCDPCPGGLDGKDSDSDGLTDCEDLCVAAGDPTNSDRDGDGVGDACDNCPDVPNRGQSDRDRDALGDACDPPGSFEILEATIAQTRAALESGELTCAALVEAHLERIARYELDAASAPYNAFAMLNENVREQAAALDEAFDRDGQLSGPLHCTVFAVKANYGTLDTDVTNGSLALRGQRASNDAAAVARLRDAGAVLIGSTGMDEFAKGIYGIGSGHGRTGNAYAPRVNPGGSSAGSAVAVSASFAQIGLGTDNCASLTLPAAYNGLVSIRGTLGLVDTAGIFPSNALDLVAGPLARSVPDLAEVLDAVAVRYDNAPAGWERPASFVDALDTNALDGARLGVLRKLSDETHAWSRYTFDSGPPATQRHWNTLFALLERQGTTVVDNLQLPLLDDTRFASNYYKSIAKFIDTTTGPVSGMGDVCRGEQFSKDVWKSKSACLWELRAGTVFLDAAAILGTPEYAKNAAHIESLMDALQLDALIFPTDARGPASSSPRDSCIVSSVSGLPAITLPIGMSNVGLPIGLTILGRAWDEGRLLSIAHAIEQRLGARNTPLVDLAQGNAIDAPLDLAAYNQLHADIAETAFELHLRDGGRAALTPDAMREVLEMVKAQ